MGSMLGEELNLKNDNSNILLNSVQNDVSKELRELPLNELLSNSLREVINTKQREIELLNKLRNTPEFIQSAQEKTMDIILNRIPKLDKKQEYAGFDSKINFVLKKDIENWQSVKDIKEKTEIFNKFHNDFSEISSKYFDKDNLNIDNIWNKCEVIGNIKTLTDIQKEGRYAIVIKEGKAREEYCYTENKTAEEILKAFSIVVDYFAIINADIEVDTNYFQGIDKESKMQNIIAEIQKSIAKNNPKLAEVGSFSEELIEPKIERAVQKISNDFVRTAIENLKSGQIIEIFQETLTNSVVVVKEKLLSPFHAMTDLQMKVQEKLLPKTISKVSSRVTSAETAQELYNDFSPALKADIDKMFDSIYDKLGTINLPLQNSSKTSVYNNYEEIEKEYKDTRNRYDLNANEFVLNRNKLLRKAKHSEDEQNKIFQEKLKESPKLVVDSAISRIASHYIDHQNISKEQLKKEKMDDILLVFAYNDKWKNNNELSRIRNSSALNTFDRSFLKSTTDLYKAMSKISVGAISFSLPGTQISIVLQAGNFFNACYSFFATHINAIINSEEFELLRGKKNLPSNKATDIICKFVPSAKVFLDKDEKLINRIVFDDKIQIEIPNLNKLQKINDRLVVDATKEFL